MRSHTHSYTCISARDAVEIIWHVFLLWRLRKQDQEKDHRLIGGTGRKSVFYHTIIVIAVSYLHQWWSSTWGGVPYSDDLGAFTLVVSWTSHLVERWGEENQRDAINLNWMLQSENNFTVHMTTLTLSFLEWQDNMTQVSQQKISQLNLSPQHVLDSAVTKEL